MKNEMFKKYIVDSTGSIYKIKGILIDKLLNTEYPHRYKLNLYFSKKDIGWAQKVRGKTAASLEVTGNGVFVKFRNNKSINLDYEELYELEVLLKEYNSVKKPFKKTKITRIKVKNK